MKPNREAGAATELKCGFCSKKFRYSSEKRRHEQSHVPQFECKDCAKRFSFLSALRRHEKQHERKGSVQCNECSREFKDEILLKRHMKYSHKGTYTCRKCDATFHSDSALCTHMKCHKPESERRYSCKFPGCMKTFNFSHHLKHHELTHTNDKQHFCKTCGRGFIQLHHLKTHQKIHEPHTWLHCLAPGCKKRFANEYSRRRHLATHKSLDSNVSADWDALLPKKSTKDTVLCISCGKTMSRRYYRKHTLKCKTSIALDKKDILEDFSTTPLVVTSRRNNSLKMDNNGIIIEEKPDDDKVNNKINHNIAFDVTQSDKVVADVQIDNVPVNYASGTCEAVIGACLVSGDSEINENCLCAQMTTHDDYSYVEVVPNHANVDILDKDKSNNRKETDENQNTLNTKHENDSKVAQESNCDGCSCFRPCSVPINNQQDIEMPQIEYRIDGTIKIKQIFDFDIKTDIDVKQKNSINNFKDESEDLKFVLFNSCKDVLGNCIVSGNSTMGEGCLCAKMSADDDQMIAQEIDEITPCPKNMWP